MICFNNSTCNACSLSLTRKNVVNGRGNPDARAWLIGRDPGSEEDACGIPFVGRAGKRLAEAIAEAGYDLEQDFYIVNLVRCHTPDNVGPTRKQMDACFKFLQLEIEEHRPDVLILLGGDVAGYFFDKDVAVSKMRGEYYFNVELEMPVIVAYHPSYLIRNGHAFDSEFIADIDMAMEYVNAD